MKLLSFEVDQDVYILGTPDYMIAEFEDERDIESIFHIGSKCGEDDDFSERVTEAFSIVLKSNPRVHEVESPEDLVTAKVLPSLAVAVLFTLAEFDSFIVMSMFRCNPNQQKWHNSGMAFKSESVDVSDLEMSRFKAMLRRATPDMKGMYVSDRIGHMDLRAHQYLPISDLHH